MTIPPYVTKWLEDNGFEELRIPHKPKSFYWSTSSAIIQCARQAKGNGFKLKYTRSYDEGDLPEKSLFTIPIPSNEQDFLTLMNILVK